MDSLVKKVVGKVEGYSKKVTPKTAKPGNKTLAEHFGKVVELIPGAVVVPVLAKNGHSYPIGKALMLISKSEPAGMDANGEVGCSSLPIGTSNVTGKPFKVSCRYATANEQKAFFSALRRLDYVPSALASVYLLA